MNFIKAIVVLAVWVLGVVATVEVVDLIAGEDSPIWAYALGGFIYGMTLGRVVINIYDDWKD